jgi:glutamate synthase (NADPH/NADH) large chain
MTGGTVVILGPIGRNFGAGMTGGMAFIHDPDNRFPIEVNPDTVIWRSVSTEYWQDVLQRLIEEHMQRTGSVQASALLSNWNREVANFVHVIPKEIITRLPAPIELSAAE